MVLLMTEANTYFQYALCNQLVEIKGFWDLQALTVIIYGCSWRKTLMFDKVVFIPDSNYCCKDSCTQKSTGIYSLQKAKGHTRLQIKIMYIAWCNT